MPGGKLHESAVVTQITRSDGGAPSERCLRGGRMKWCCEHARPFRGESENILPNARQGTADHIRNVRTEKVGRYIVQERRRRPQPQRTKTRRISQSGEYVF